MSHFFAQTENGIAYLTEEDLYHAEKSLRLKPGESITLAADGKKYAAKFDPANRYILSDLLPDPEPGLQVTLFQGIPKGDKMETIVQAATQCGVYSVVPVLFRRCVSQWDEKSAAKKTARLQKIALEAAKQSGRCVVPGIGTPVSPEAIPVDRFDAVLMPWEESARQGQEGLRAWWNTLAVPPRTAALIIGPEGGIDEAEAHALTGRGAVPVSLGKRIFRTETAGFAALAALMLLSGDLE